MGRRRREREIHKSQTLPPSPSHSFSSSSSSEFEFTITLSPSKKTSPQCPADELFYKGKLLPLQLSPRLSMVRTLLLSSPSSSSSDTTTTASRDSTGSNSSFGSDLGLGLLSNDLDSARQSSVTEEDEQVHHHHHQIKKTSTNKYFSLFSSVFKGKNREQEQEKNVKKVSVLRKYLKKVKPLYDKFSSQKQKLTKIECSVSVSASKTNNNGGFQDSFSGNLKYPIPKRRRCVSSCPSSMRSSPTHPYSLLPRTSLVTAKSIGSTPNCSELSSMEELQSAIQGAIAHCKNSMIQSTTSTWKHCEAGMAERFDCKLGKKND